MKEIHQLLAGASVGDAITNYALEIKDILTSLDIQSKIFAPFHHTSPELRDEILPASENLSLINNKDATLIYHFSIGSGLTKYFIDTPARKILCYHNITPEKYLQSISSKRANTLREGREELKKLKSVPDISLAVSSFNASEMENFGFQNVGVIPLTINTSYLKTEPSRSIIRKTSDSFTNILFVGRVSPNKKLEDVIKVFYYYNKTINPSSRLIFVGSYVGMEKYYTYLKSLASEMGLQNVIFTGHVSLEDLLGYYSSSSLFLCMSEHEGVCIPLIECMFFKKPVFALARAAVPETLGNTGVLIKNKNFREIAELIDIVMNDSNLLNGIVESQNKRVKDFHQDILKEKLKAVLGL